MISAVLVFGILVVGNRLSDFYIRVGNDFKQTSFNPTSYTECWHQPSALGAGKTRQFTCTSFIEGRYVTIHFPLDKSEHLILCEVKVYSDLGKTLVQCSK